MVRLKAMIADPGRSWIAHAQSPKEYANGTRLFAYRALRDKLSCAEITSALNEIDAAARTFATPVAGVTAEQANHLLSLNSEVGQDLRTEFSNRCKG